jgi:hypothetical protein
VIETRHFSTGGLTNPIEKPATAAKMEMEHDAGASCRPWSIASIGRQDFFSSFRLIAGPASRERYNFQTEFVRAY